MFTVSNRRWPFPHGEDFVAGQGHFIMLVVVLSPAFSSGFNEAQL